MCVCTIDMSCGDITSTVMLNYKSSLVHALISNVRAVHHCKILCACMCVIEQRISLGIQLHIKYVNMHGYYPGEGPVGTHNTHAYTAGNLKY